MLTHFLLNPRIFHHIFQCFFFTLLRFNSVWLTGSRLCSDLFHAQRMVRASVEHTARIVKPLSATSYRRRIQTIVLLLSIGEEWFGYIQHEGLVDRKSVV